MGELRRLISTSAPSDRQARTRTDQIHAGLPHSSTRPAIYQLYSTLLYTRIVSYVLQRSQKL